MTSSVPIHDSLIYAGASAREHADLLEPLIGSTERQIASLRDALTALRKRQGDYRVGGEGEYQTAMRVQQVLVDFGSCDWHLLADRRWPGTRNANLDLILVGPPGVLLLDAKSWAEPRVEGGSLWRGQLNVDDEIDAALRAAEAVADVLADVGLAPAAIRPIFVLVGRMSAAVDVGGVTVVGELALPRELMRIGPRLNSAQVAALVAAIDELCPPASKMASAGHTHAARTSESTMPPVEAAALIDVQDILDAAIEVAAREPIEAWMTWLHPAQAHLVTRRYSGPAQVRGAAGTGKTVVALHRARELAKHPQSRVLVTSFVRTLPDVQRSLFVRLAPDLGRRVEFRGLHSWAFGLLKSRKCAPALAVNGGQDLFDQAWHATGMLSSSSLPRQYWRDEIEHVIKGRGLVELDDYLALVRVGRRTPLREEQRRAVWNLYQDYQRRLHDNGECDWSDVVLLALGSITRVPIEPAYTAVIVDEVQDLTCMGLRLLHALVGDAPDGLLLVGDGQQSVYPGGFTLAETGVAVTGRATVLNRNYRNASEIMKAAFEVVSSDLFDDLDADRVAGVREVEIERLGGKVARKHAGDATEQRADLIHALRSAAADDTRVGDMAVLVPDNRQADQWAAALSSSGVAAELLVDYRGTTSDAVKVGTYQRAKGLEFKCVFIPDHDKAVPSRTATETDDAYRERAELQRRQLFVAMTRARDRLWLGSRSA
ncbi:MAG TPA: 3'-5' exonuclease [Acidothermaceae bacterium]